LLSNFTFNLSFRQGKRSQVPKGRAKTKDGGNQYSGVRASAKIRFLKMRYHKFMIDLKKSFEALSPLLKRKDQTPCRRLADIER
jgi:hypothetical protein